MSERPELLVVFLAALVPPASAGEAKPARGGEGLQVRMTQEQLRNPFWYAANGQPEEAERFWDERGWDQALRTRAEEGYNAILYWCEPWQEHQWQTFVIRHRDFPEARDLKPEDSERVIAHVNRVFRRAHELGLKNFLFTYSVVTTRAFARAHGTDRELPLSSTVDYRHNQRDPRGVLVGSHLGVRSDQTRAFTEASIAELFQTYPELDGLIGQMAEALPGKRNTWYREAVVPGLKRSGRNPIFIRMNWMLPVEDFLEDIASPEVYGGTWLSVSANGEVLTDPEPYPAALRWAEKAGVPVLLEIVHHNFADGFPCNSPKLAHQILREYRKVHNCTGYVAWYLRSDPNWLLRRALGHYGKDDVPYSKEPWVSLLAERFGSREAGRRLLRAFDASARVTMEVSAFAWCPQDIGHSQQLILPYRQWTREEPRWNSMVSPVSAGVLLPLRHYASVVARHGDQFRDNNGSIHSRNSDHPGAQELFWGLTDYPIAPEAHMRSVRALGEEGLREAEAAMPAVERNHQEAQAAYK